MAGLDLSQVTSVATGIAKVQALKLIGGSPILKAIGSTVDLLKLPKSLDIGNLGEILQDVVENGLGAVLQNPIGAVVGELQGVIGNAGAALAGIADAAGLTEALGALSDAAGLVHEAAGLLSGATAAVGDALGLVDVMAHAGLAEAFGSALPSGLGLDVVLGPIASAGRLAEIAGGLPAMVAAVASGDLSPADALATVSGHAAELSGLVMASSAALRTMQDAAPAIATVTAVAATLVSGPAPLQAAVQAALVPAAASAIGAVVDAHLADIFDGEPGNG